MRILLWHGYLLRGSGSNIYTSNVARVWRADGHDVLLVCQEQHPEEFDFIDAHGDVSAGTSWSWSSLPREAAAGRCRLARPNIGDLLPVYVQDAYDGFTVKRFVDLTDDELGRYTQANVETMAALIDWFDPEAIVTGHEVMGPYIARLACEQTATSFVAKLHGSALEYAVKLQQRYLQYARHGLGAAKVVIGGSRYMLEEAGRVVPEVLERGAVVNPGCDVDLFRPMERDGDDRPTVGYVGKFIPQKGVHNFLASLGLTRGGFDVVLVGYGGLEPRLRALWGALEEGDTDAAQSIASDGDGEPLEDLSSFFEAAVLQGAYSTQRLASISLTFTGRLEHEPLARVLPRWDALVVPSVLPEAFGMVAAEAAACGVLPIVPRHSGIGEVGAAIEGHLGLPGLLTFDPGDPVRDIARRIDAILALRPQERYELGRAASELARERWSWEHVARRLLEHAAPAP